MPKPKAFTENVPLSECKPGDRLWIRFPGIHAYSGHYDLLKIKPIGKGKVQVKFVSAWCSPKKPGKVLKADAPADLIVERSPPVARKGDVELGDGVTVLGPETAKPNEEARPIGMEDAFAVLNISGLDGLWPGGMR